MVDFERKVVYDIGGMFQVEHQVIAGRALPYEFVSRIGAVTVFPICTDEQGNASVMTVFNDRTHYGESFELVGGNADGGFSDPENPYDTARRELQEETGYAATDIEVLAMQVESRTIRYPRYFAVARGLSYVGGELDSPSERITIAPTPLDEYLDTILEFSRSEVFPDVTLAFAKAERAVGRERLVDWLVDGAHAQDVRENFAPWMHFTTPSSH